MSGASFLVWVVLNAHAVAPDRKLLPIGLSPNERSIPISLDSPMTEPPKGTARSLGEWEISDSAITLWNNPSFVSALARRGKLTLLADGDSEKSWWENWVTTHQIPATEISYLIIPTDSIWIRDYGPWYILDGEGSLGLVDTKYNRPRPKDDLVPGFIASALGLPIYQPGLVHTGGNYYSDGHGNAFSSTLVYTENAGLSKPQVSQRMLQYLGVGRYTTSRLAPGITIEHLDTFGKLVAPDTWVFSDFPVGSRFRDDSENMVKLLATLKSPYGTPYKIFRMKMTPISGSSGENYRAYINSFISNHTLYYPTYGGPADDTARQVFQKALPGYEILGVDGQGTSWGDSVHCRSNNLYSRRTIFLFPTVTRLPSGDTPGEIQAEVYPSPGGRILEPPLVHLKINGIMLDPAPMRLAGDRFWSAEIPALPVGTSVSFYLSAKDSMGVQKIAPWKAPQMTIDFTI